MKRPPICTGHAAPSNASPNIAVTVLVHLGALTFPEDRPRPDQKGRR